MKKLLLATTMLVGTAGFAAAEVTLSGDARMGIIGGDNVDTTFTSRARVSFGLSGETDGGLSFGASFRADNAGGAAAGDAGSVYISGAFGKISMGDVDSADNIGQLSGVGFTGLGDSNEVEYSADGVSLFGFVSAWNAAEKAYCDDTSDVSSQLDCLADDHGVKSASSKVLYTYAVDGLSVSASASQNGDLKSYALGATYTAGDLTVGAGYGVADIYMDSSDIVSGPDIEAGGHVKDLTLMAAYTLGSTTLKGIYQHKDLSASVFGEDIAGDADSYGVSVDHAIDALILTGFIKTTEASDAISGGLLAGDAVETLRTTSYGIGASYDLGGGASIAGGVAHVDTIDWDVDGGVSAEKAEDTKFDLGVKFSF